MGNFCLKEKSIEIDDAYMIYLNNFENFMSGKSIDMRIGNIDAKTGPTLNILYRYGGYYRVISRGKLMEIPIKYVRYVRVLELRKEDKLPLYLLKIKDTALCSVERDYEQIDKNSYVILPAEFKLVDMYYIDYNEISRYIGDKINEDVTDKMYVNIYKKRQYAAFVKYEVVIDEIKTYGILYLSTEYIKLVIPHGVYEDIFYDECGNCFYAKTHNNRYHILDRDGNVIIETRVKCKRYKRTNFYYSYGFKHTFRKTGPAPTDYEREVGEIITKGMYIIGLNIEENEEDIHLLHFYAPDTNTLV